MRLELNKEQLKPITEKDPKPIKISKDEFSKAPMLEARSPASLRRIVYGTMASIPLGYYSYHSIALANKAIPVSKSFILTGQELLNTINTYIIQHPRTFGFAAAGTYLAYELVRGILKNYVDKTPSKVNATLEDGTNVEIPVIMDRNQIGDKLVSLTSIAAKSTFLASSGYFIADIVSTYTNASADIINTLNTTGNYLLGALSIYITTTTIGVAISEAVRGVMNTIDIATKKHRIKTKSKTKERLKVAWDWTKDITKRGISATWNWIKNTPKKLKETYTKYKEEREKKKLMEAKTIKIDEESNKDPSNPSQ